MHQGPNFEHIVLLRDIPDPRSASLLDMGPGYFPNGHAFSCALVVLVHFDVLIMGSLTASIYFSVY